MKYSKLKTVLSLLGSNSLFRTQVQAPRDEVRLTADETFEAEKYWINVTQDSSFSHEINLLKAGKDPELRLKKKSET